jgi:adenosylmethionine-8-amino-7-oxononanoate aminotransferase
MFACEKESVVPDILCLGKGLTAGYLPLSATIARRKVYQAFLGDDAEGRMFCHGHTYGGNPLAAAVALANLQLFESTDLLSRIRPTIERLSEHLRHLAVRSQIRSVRHVGLMAGIEIAAESELTASAVCKQIRSRGVILRPLGNVIVVMPPLTISIAELDKIFNALQESLSSD